MANLSKQGYEVYSKGIGAQMKALLIISILALAGCHDAVEITYNTITKEIKYVRPIWVNHNVSEFYFEVNPDGTVK